MFFQNIDFLTKIFTSISNIESIDSFKLVNLCIVKSMFTKKLSSFGVIKDTYYLYGNQIVSKTVYSILRTPTYVQPLALCLVSGGPLTQATLLLLESEIRPCDSRTPSFG